MGIETLLKTVPKYDGKGGAIEWLYKFEASIDLLNIPPEKILSHILLFLEGEAYLWYSCVLDFVMFDSLDTFRDYFLRWFASPTEKAMDSLSQCHFEEGGSFREYIMAQSRIFSSLNQLLDDVAKIQWFFRGLPEKWLPEFLPRSFKRYEELAFHAISLDTKEPPKPITTATRPFPKFIRVPKLAIPKRRTKVFSSTPKERSVSAHHSESSIHSSEPTNHPVRATHDIHIKAYPDPANASHAPGQNRQDHSILKRNPPRERTKHSSVRSAGRNNRFHTDTNVILSSHQSSMSPKLTRKKDHGRLEHESVSLSGLDPCDETRTTGVEFSSTLEAPASFKIRKGQGVGLNVGENLLT